jgi:hypothetical protein
VPGCTYSLRCVECAKEGIQSVYIGKTGRTLTERVKEHFYRNRKVEQRSDIFCHSEYVHGDVSESMWEAKL